jgi:serine-type D-Ala-D-Ala carboxypeptidase/endopeptidase (penicillin-binding protein 4)
LWYGGEVTLRRALQLGLALTTTALVASIQWSPATSQAAGSTKQAAAPAVAPRPAAAGSEPPAGEPGAATTAAEVDDGVGDGPARAVSEPPADPAERSRWLTRELEATLAAHPGLASAKVAVAVADLGSGAPLWQLRADERMSLASTTKLFTAAAALRALGAGFTWRTALYGGERPGATPSELVDDTVETLYLRGRGDPTLEYAAMQTLARDLVALGIRRISKELVLDTSYFDSAIEPPHFAEQPKEYAAFRAPVAALSMNRSSITVIISPPRDAAHSPEVRFDPPLDGIVELNVDELVPTADGQTRVRLEPVPATGKASKRSGKQRPPGPAAFKLRGQIAIGGAPLYRRIRVDDPLALVVAALRAALREQGIRAPTRVSAAEVPPTARLLVAVDSPPLGEVVRRMNKTSDNFLAEAIFKTLGAERRAAPGPGSWADGVAAMQAFLVALPPPIRIDNGSGLFDASDASAAQLVALLREAHRDFRIAPDLLASLPIGEVDGTLRSRFHGRAAAGLVRAKTGTLAKVSTLAGYVGVDAQRLLAFAVLLNELAPAQRADARLLQEDLVEVLARYTGASAPSKPLR